MKNSLGSLFSPLAKQLVGTTKLCHLAVGENEDAVAVHDRVQAVGDGEHRAVAELLPD